MGGRGDRGDSRGRRRSDRDDRGDRGRGDRGDRGRDRRGGGGGDSVEDWCRENGLDDKCTDFLVNQPADIQDAVMEKGLGPDCRNPNAVVMSRVRKLEGKGGSEGGGGG